MVSTLHYSVYFSPLYSLLFIFFNDKGWQYAFFGQCTGENTLYLFSNDASGELTAVGSTLAYKEVNFLGVGVIEATEEEKCGMNGQVSTTETDTEVVKRVAEDDAHVRKKRGPGRSKVSKNKRVAMTDKGLGVERGEGKTFTGEEASQLKKAWVQTLKKDRTRLSRGYGTAL